MTKGDFRRFLLTFEALSDLGREMTADRDFPLTARVLLRSVCELVAARQGVLLTFDARAVKLTSLASQNFVNFPETAVIPLSAKQGRALSNARGPLVLSPGTWELYLSSSGNIAPELFKCIVSLRVGSKLVGVLALGRRDQEAPYDHDALAALGLVSNYLALAVHNHVLAESLETRIAENLRLLSSLNSFYDQTLEVFANAIDIKHANIHGHSLRVGRYASGIGQAMGVDPGEVAGIKAAGYLHDIGMIAVDKRIWEKPSALDPDEFREMTDHTLVGHRIVSGVEFPWPKVPEVVRSHHERADGSGYPDGLRRDEIPQPARVVAVADTFDAMTSERPYRQRLSVGATLSELVRQTPQKFDPGAVKGLLDQVRGDATGSNSTPFLDPKAICNIGASDIDDLTASLLYKLSEGRRYDA